MRTLVTGATGQVGRRFVPRLLQWCGPEDEVRVLVRAAPRGARLAELGARCVPGDLREEADVRHALDGVDSVVNVAAAFRDVPDEEAWSVNRDAALLLGRTAVDAGVRRFVHVGTNLSYGVSRGRPLVEEDETVPGGPMWGAYAASKAEAEQGLLALSRSTGLDLRIGSLAFVYGEGDPHLEQAVRWARTWPGNKRLPVVHHADVAAALRLLLSAPLAPATGRKFNVVDDAPVTAVELHQINGVPVPEDMADRTDDDPWHGVTSNARLREQLGWRPLHPTVWTARDAGAL